MAIMKLRRRDSVRKKHKIIRKVIGDEMRLDDFKLEYPGIVGALKPGEKRLVTSVIEQEILYAVVTGVQPVSYSSLSTETLAKILLLFFYRVRLGLDPRILVFPTLNAAELNKPSSQLKTPLKIVKFPKDLGPENFVYYSWDLRDTYSCQRGRKLILTDSGLYMWRYATREPATNRKKSENQKKFIATKSCFELLNIDKLTRLLDDCKKKKPFLGFELISSIHNRLSSIMGDIGRVKTKVNNELLLPVSNTMSRISRNH